jgi:hypothetical protein
VCCYNRCHGNAVKGFSVLWDNIYDYVVFTTLNFPSFMTGNLPVYYTVLLCARALEVDVVLSVSGRQQMQMEPQVINRTSAMYDEQADCSFILRRCTK